MKGVHGPKTRNGWIQLVASTVVIISTIGGAVYAMDSMYARKAEVEEIEQRTVSSIQTLQCNIIDQQIRALREDLKLANLTTQERSRLQLRLEAALRDWDRFCVR